MLETEASRSRLLIFGHPMGAGWKTIDALEDLPYADITDASNRMLFRSSPEEFFSLYAGATTIINAHLCEELLESALIYLADHPGRKIVLAGRFSDVRIEQAKNLAESVSVDLVAKIAAEPRLFRARIEEGRIVAFVPSGGFAGPSEAFGSCLAAGYGVRGAQHWTQLWKTDILAPALELGVRKRDALYGVARELARRTAQPLNWSDAGVLAGVPGITVREWAQLLERLCALRIVPAVNLKPQRRTLDRPKLYWRHPGFGLWLSGQMISPDDAVCRAFFENTVYLALTDCYPSARILHFMDTNRVTCPLVVEQDGAYRAFYIYENSKQRDQALRHHRSLVKTGRFAPAAGMVAYEGMTQTASVHYETPEGAGEL